MKGPKGTTTFSKEKYLIYYSSLVHSALVQLQPGVGTCDVLREQAVPFANMAFPSASPIDSRARVPDFQSKISFC